MVYFVFERYEIKKLQKHSLRKFIFKVTSTYFSFLSFEKILKYKRNNCEKSYKQKKTNFYLKCYKLDIISSLSQIESSYLNCCNVNTVYSIYSTLYIEIKIHFSPSPILNTNSLSSFIDFKSGKNQHSNLLNSRTNLY